MEKLVKLVVPHAITSFVTLMIVGWFFQVAGPANLRVNSILVSDGERLVSISCTGVSVMNRSHDDYRSTDIYIDGIKTQHADGTVTWYGRSTQPVQQEGGPFKSI